MAASKKSSTASTQAAAKRSAVRKAAPAKTSSAKKTPAKKAPVNKVPAKQVPATKTPTRKAPAKKVAAKKAPPKKVTAEKAPAKKAPAKQPEKKAPGKVAAVKKAPAKKAPAKKASPAKAPATASAARRPRRPESPGTPSILSNFRPERHELPAPRGKSKDGLVYTKDFDVKFLRAQRAELLARRSSELARATRLEDEASSLIEDGEMGDVQFDDEGGEGDTMVVQRDLDRVLSTQARQTIEEIDAALERIKVGTYGYSEVSGLPIPRERLEALPETTVLAAEKVSGVGPR